VEWDVINSCFVVPPCQAVASVDAGVRRYGKNYRAIAEVIGNKNESLVRSFFVTYRRRFKLDEVLAEYEKEHGVEEKPQREEVRNLCCMLSCFFNKSAVNSFPFQYNGQCLPLFLLQSFSALSAFSALTLLVGWQEGHPACKN